MPDVTWYLVFRGLCVWLFVAAVVALFAAAGASDNRRPWPLIAVWLAVAVVLAVSGCLLLGVGWGGDHA